MAKQKSIIRVLSFSIIISFLLAGCNGDDSVGPTPELVGTWQLTKLTVTTADDVTILTEAQLTAMGAYWIVKLKSDNTFESNWNLDGLENETGTWQASATQLTVTFSSGDSQIFQCSLSGNTMTLEWTDVEDGVQEALIGVFTRQ